MNSLDFETIEDATLDCNVKICNTMFTHFITTKNVATNPESPFMNRFSKTTKEKIDVAMLWAIVII